MKSIVVLCHFILLTVLLVAVSMPNIKTRYPSSKEMARFRWTNMWTAWNNFFLQKQEFQLGKMSSNYPYSLFQQRHLSTDVNTTKQIFFHLPLQYEEHYRNDKADCRDSTSNVWNYLQGFALHYRYLLPKKKKKNNVTKQLRQWCSGISCMPNKVVQIAQSCSNYAMTPTTDLQSSCHIH